MKALITAIGVGAILVVPMAAIATPVDFIWDGDNSRSWVVDANWTAGSSWPGNSQADDTATISNANNANPLFLNASLNNSVASLTVDADTATGDLEFELRTNSSMTVTDSITLWGDDDADHSATLQFIGGTLAFDSASLNLFGGDTADRKAIFDYDGGTISDNIDAMTMRGHSEVASTQDITVGGDLVVDADAYATEAVINMADSDDDFTANSVIVGHDTYGCKLTFSGSGSLTTN
jgi:hypothetical protein